MKHWKRAVCLLTTWLLLISMCVLTSVAKTPSSKAASGRNYRTVTVIGDSLATGFMIQNRDGSYVEHTHGKRIRAAWPSRVADSVNATVYNNYAREGSGTNEILRLLDPDYEPDTYFKEVSDRVIEKYFDGEAAFAMYQKEVRTDIEQSDLILLNCGSNDLFATVNTVFRKLMNNELDSVKAQAKRKVLLQLKDTVDALVAEGQFAKAWATIYQVLSTINMADDAVEALLECATRGYLNFQKNWGRISKTIHDSGTYGGTYQFDGLTLPYCGFYYYNTGDSSWSIWQTYSYSVDVGDAKYWGNSMINSEEAYTFSVSSIDMYQFETYTADTEWPASALQVRCVKQP